MSDTIRISPGQVAESLELRNASALANCTEVDGDHEGVVIRQLWPTLSDGEALLWRVLGWLNGENDLPPENDLRAGLDLTNFAAVQAIR